ncbi:hypothetical protein J6590_072901 [Homalodisca vitripennis]|nr:hypothetical protein J6590_072901 [Homalodisca vitripennis]
MYLGESRRTGSSRSSARAAGSPGSPEVLCRSCRWRAVDNKGNDSLREAACVQYAACGENNEPRLLILKGLEKGLRVGDVISGQ